MAEESWGLLTGEQANLAVIARDDRIIRICYLSSPSAAIAMVNKLYPGARHSEQRVITECVQQLGEYFSGLRRSFTLDLDNDALSPFARRVQGALIRVPYGTVVSYAELAILAGYPKAARAVGMVMSSNPFPLIVPCHRVVRADGGIGQYSAANGSQTKCWLINFERQHSPE